MPRLFGEKLRLLRRRHNMTQVELADQLGLASQGYIANLEAGQEAPSLDLIIRIARVLDVTTDYLLRDTIPVEGENVGIANHTYTTILPFVLGERLRALRLQRGISQRDLAHNLRLASRAYISNIEAGRKAPSTELIVKIADLFGVTTDYLLWGASP
jgi:transcriptional regulator with XRE-family HTH domain